MKREVSPRVRRVCFFRKETSPGGEEGWDVYVDPELLEHNLTIHIHTHSKKFTHTYGFCYCGK